MKKTTTRKTSPKRAASSSGIQAFVHASFVYTGEGIVEKEGRMLVPSDLSEIEDGAVVFDARKILWVGPTAELPKEFRSMKKTDLKNKSAVMPGLIDAHTHLVFAGSRAHEFARRCAGTTYKEIADEGGGILNTVKATREASVEALFEVALKRALIAYRHGVRTLECKSGYGLDHKTELKCLQVVKDLQEALPQMTFVSTYLGAHAIPVGVKKPQYIDEIIHKTLPEVKKKNLATFCDVFIDEGYFTYAEGERILRAAKKLGLGVKIHADELTETDSARLAAKLEASSADHLLKISDKGIQALAKSNTVAMMLPGTAFYLKANYAPARKLLDAGARVGIATDFNPGSCYSLNLPLMMNLSALYLSMNSAEIFAGVTYSAAASLGLQDRKGALLAGFDSDFVVLPYDRFEEMYYRMGW
ncbi:MAG: imidazolonepropionase [Bdellovibrionales bacterium]|nr:imidazolonepropionase [Bdellovibrionales bacterium]